MKINRRRDAGVTFFEIMIALAMMATLATIAVPSVQRNMRRSRGAACGVELRMAEAAKKAWAIDHPGETMPTNPTAANGVGAYYTPANILPRCPAGGTYSNLTDPTKPCACSLNSVTPIFVEDGVKGAELGREDMDIGGKEGWHQNGYHDLGPR